MTMTPSQAVTALHGTESQREFARRIGVTINTLRYIGYGEAISPRQMIKLLKEARRQHREDCYQVLHDEMTTPMSGDGWIVRVDVQPKGGAGCLTNEFTIR